MTPTLFIIVSFSTYHTTPGKWQVFIKCWFNWCNIFLLLLWWSQNKLNYLRSQVQILQEYFLSDNGTVLHTFIHSSLLHSINKYLLCVSSRTCSSQHVKDKPVKQWTRQKHRLTSGSLEKSLRKDWHRADDHEEHKGEIQGTVSEEGKFNLVRWRFFGTIEGFPQELAFQVRFREGEGVGYAKAGLQGCSSRQRERHTHGRVRRVCKPKKKQVWLSTAI